MTPDDWAIVSAISTALGALASFTAVVAALWLAGNANRPRLSIKATIGLKLHPSGPRDIIIVEVSNTGARAEKITSVWFRARGRRPRMLFEISRDEDDAQLPTRVEPGETATFVFEPLEFLRDIGRAEEFIKRRMPWRKVRTRRIYTGAQTATDFVVTSRVSPVLQALFDTENANLFISFHLTPDHPAYPHVQSGVRGFFSTTQITAR